MLKYWICKRAPSHAVECLECFGGNGFVEESGMPRLFRESPLNSIWEGSGNVQCLDVLRAMVKSPASVDAFFGEVLEGAGAEPRLDAYVAELREEIPGDVETIQERARRVVERMAIALQASLLVRYGDEAVADAFCASRLSGDWGHAFGTLPPGTDFGRIIERHRPSPLALDDSPSSSPGDTVANLMALRLRHPRQARSRSARPTCSAVITPARRPSASTAIRAPKRRRFWLPSRVSSGASSRTW